MSVDSLAALRKTAGEDFAQIAEQHIQHDLSDQDRAVLEKAASSLGIYATVGSVIGLGLGAALAFRVRSARTSMFRAFRAQEKPTFVEFPGGKKEPIPDLTNMLKPTTLGDVAAYTFFSAGGIFLGGELGGLAGSLSASRTLSKDPESRKRIEMAFRRFRADVLRKEAQQLEQGEIAVKGF
ncbi:MAG: hypothetical protein Q9162_000764 [Coniocarpon cinnabarinum]